MGEFGNAFPESDRPEEEFIFSQAQSAVDETVPTGLRPEFERILIEQGETFFETLNEAFFSRVVPEDKPATTPPPGPEPFNFPNVQLGGFKLDLLSLVVFGVLFTVIVGAFRKG